MNRAFTLLLLVLLIPSAVAHSGGGAPVPAASQTNVHDVIASATFTDAGDVEAIVVPFSPPPLQVGATSALRGTAHIRTAAENVTLIGRADGYWSAVTTLDALDERENVAKLVFEPRQGTQTTWLMRAVGSRNEPLPGTEIHALWNDGTHTLYQSETTGDDGAVRFDFPGAGHLHAWAVNDFYMLAEARQNVSGPEPVDLRLAPRADVSILTGRVTLGGDPVAGVPVYLQNPISSRGRVLYMAHAVTGENGTFHVAARGTHVSLIAQGPHADRTVTVPIKETQSDLRIELAPGPDESLVRVLVEDDQGAPVRAASVQVMSLLRPDIGYAGTTGRAGEYAAIMPRGRASLYVSCADCRPPLIERTSFPDIDSEEETLRVVLPRDPSEHIRVSGRVFSNGEALADAVVALVDPDAPAVLKTAVSGPDGSFELSSPARSRLLLVADGPTLMPPSGRLEPFVKGNGFSTVVREIGPHHTEGLDVSLPRANDSYQLELQVGSDGAVTAQAEWHPHESFAVLRDLVLPLRHGIVGATSPLLQQLYELEPALQRDLAPPMLEAVYLKARGNATRLETESLNIVVDEGDFIIRASGRGTLSSVEARAQIYSTVPEHLDWTLLLRPPDGSAFRPVDGTTIHEASLTLHLPATLAPKEIVIPLALDTTTRAAAPFGALAALAAAGLVLAVVAFRPR